MLPAQHGDASAPSRVLIDAGTPPTHEVVKERILQLEPDDRRFELLVVTHIDTDHIGGVLKLLADDTLGLEFDEVWFNAWRHLEAVPTDRLGPIDGEILSVLLDHAGSPWNDAFGEGPAMVPADGALPSHELPGGMTLTLLSPGAEQLLDRLGAEEIDVEHLAGSEFVPDRAEANGSTIAVLAEFDGASAVLAGDGFPDVIAPNVARLIQERGTQKLAIDVFKLPHHGSMHNISNDLLSLVSCGRYLFSSSGAIFGHPDQEAVARVIVNGGSEPELLFNYRTELNGVWDDAGLMDEFGYTVAYPADDAPGLTVDLM